MKIIKNALSEDLFSRCKKEVNQKLSKNEWSSSVIIWEPGLRQGISGSTIAAMTSEEIHNDIVKEISPHVPECEIVTQYYVWQPHSGIAMHDDSGRRFGATIYLNETWHPILVDGLFGKTKILVNGIQYYQRRILWY